MYIDCFVTIYHHFLDHYDVVFDHHLGSILPHACRQSTSALFPCITLRQWSQAPEQVGEALHLPTQCRVVVPTQGGTWQ